jgi:hypothetical protein
MEDTLGINVGDSVHMKEQFGQMAKKMAGIGGTLHITDTNGIGVVPQIAWDLSGKTGKPVIIVVRNAPQPPQR